MSAELENPGGLQDDRVRVVMEGRHLGKGGL